MNFWSTSLFSASCSPIGLDAGSATVKAVQLRFDPRLGRWKLAAFCRLPRASRVGGRCFGPLEPAQAQRLADVLRRQGFEGSRVVACVTPAALISAPVTLPPRSAGAPLDDIARAQAADAARVDPHSLHAVWWDVPVARRAHSPGSPVNPNQPGPATEPTQGLVAAVRDHDLRAILHPLQQAGLEPVAVDSRAWALARACAPLLPPDGSIACLVDLAEHDPGLTLLADRRVVYERPLPDLTLAALRSRAAERFRVPSDLVDGLLTGSTPPEPLLGARVDILEAELNGYAAALAREIVVSIEYAAARTARRPGPVLLTGGGAALANLHDRLAKGVGAHCRVVTLPDVLDLQPETGINYAALAPNAPDTPAADLLLAAGLAMHDARLALAVGDAPSASESLRNPIAAAMHQAAQHGGLAA